MARFQIGKISKFRQCDEKPVEYRLDTPPALSFCDLLLFPLLELPLTFLTLKELLNLREQDPRQGVHFVVGNAGAVVVRFLLCQALSSISRYEIFKVPRTVPLCPDKDTPSQKWNVQAVSRWS